MDMPIPNFFSLFALLYIVFMVGVLVVVVVAIWRAVLAHERIAESLAGIERELRGRGAERPRGGGAGGG